jgi:hypothetical protein
MHPLQFRKIVGECVCCAGGEETRLAHVYSEYDAETTGFGDELCAADEA